MRWVKVSDRLPPNSGYYLTWAGPGFRVVIHYYEGAGYWIDENVEILYWARLPRTPKHTEDE